MPEIGIVLGLATTEAEALGVGVLLGEPFPLVRDLTIGRGFVDVADKGIAFEVVNPAVVLELEGVTRKWH